MNDTNKHIRSDQLTRHFDNIENKNPSTKIATMINQYYAIDDMFATNEEKRWAKVRLHDMIIRLMKHVSKDAHYKIKASLDNKANWEDYRETFY